MRRPPSPARPVDAPRPPRGLYERVVRVVAYLFIAAALVVVAVGGNTQQPLIYVLAASGLFLVVVGQDILPTQILGMRRLAIEALAMIVFVSILVVLTGGYASPFFIGYVLVVAGAALWGNAQAPLLLAAAACLAYLAAVFVTPLVVGGSVPADALARVAFILVALGLVAYVAAVISREQRRTSEAALALSRFDALTGLFSRSYFERSLEQETLRAGRSNRPFSMLLLDLDSLKAVNDSFGHDSGDRLLGAIGEVIRGGVRATDVAARLGGDEFVIILPETDLTGALRVAEKLRRDIGHLSLPMAGKLISSTVSAGAVTFPDDANNAAELLRRADRAMYEAKRRGKDQVVHYPRAVGEEATAAEAAAESLIEAEPAGQTTAAEPALDASSSQPEAVVSGDAPWQVARAEAVAAPAAEGEPEVVVSGKAPWE